MDFLDTVFYFFIMIVVIVGAYLFTKYLSKKGQRNKTKHIHVVDRLALGKDKVVVLIEVNGKNLLIGATDHNINLLDHIEPNEFEIKAEEQEKAEQKGFASRLKDIIVNLKNAPDNLNKARTKAKTTSNSKVKNEDDFLDMMDDAIERRKSRNYRQKENE